MVNYLRLIRWPNLVVIALLLFSCRYFVFSEYLDNFALTFVPVLSNFNFFLLILSIILITIGGYIINDIEDVQIDKINKPGKNIFENSLSIDKGIKAYYLCTLLGILLGIWVGWQYENIQLAMPHLLASGLLWIYAKNFKKSLLLGNTIIALLSALVPITYLFFESHPFIIKYVIGLRTYYENAYLEGPVAVLIQWTLMMAVFGFLTTLSREIIKDIQDVEGDTKQGAKTLAISYGKKVAQWVALIPLLLNLYFVHFFTSRLPFFEELITTLKAYLYIVCGSVFIYFILKILAKKLDPEFSSKLLKVMMLLGICSSTIVLWMM